VVIHLYDQREINLPRLGIIPVHDAESGRTVWANTSSASFRNGLRDTFRQNQVRLEQLCRQFNANYLALDSQEDFIPKLIDLFRVRR